MAVPNPADPLYQCAVAYKSMSDRPYHDRHSNITGRDVKYEIEMVTSDFREREVNNLQGIRTYTVAFSGMVYSAGTGAYGFQDRIEALKKFETFMDNIPNYSARGNFDIFTMNNSSSNIPADYIIQFKDSIAPIGSAPTAAPTVSYTSYFLTKNSSIFKKKDDTQLYGMSCFTDNKSYGLNQCTVLSITKKEQGQAPQVLYTNPVSRASIANAIQDYNNDIKASIALERIAGYRKRFIDNPEGKSGEHFTNEQSYDNIFHNFLCDSADYSNEVLQNLRDKLKQIPADYALRQHIKYEINAVNAVLLARHLSELRDDMISSGNKKDYEDFLNLAGHEVSGNTNAAQKTQQFISQYQIHGNFNEIMPHIERILKVVLAKDERNKDGRFPSLSDEQKEAIQTETELFSADNPNILYMQNVLDNSEKHKIFQSANGDVIALSNRMGDFISEKFSQIIDFLKEKAESFLNLFRKKNDDSKPDDTEPPPEHGSSTDSVSSEKKSEPEQIQTKPENVQKQSGRYVYRITVEIEVSDFCQRDEGGYSLVVPDRKSAVGLTMEFSKEKWKRMIPQKDVVQSGQEQQYSDNQEQEEEKHEKDKYEIDR